MYAVRDEPDTRDYIYVLHPTSEREWTAQSAADGERLYFRLEQWDVGAGFDLKSRFDHFELKLGSMLNVSRRDYRSRRFVYRRGNILIDYGAPPEELFSPQFSGAGWALTEITVPRDSFRSVEDLYAAYGSLEYRPVERLRLVGGVRAEAFRQRLAANPLVQSEDVRNFAEVFRTDVDPLPAASGVLELVDDMFLRAGYSTTIARPRSRELAQALILDFVRRREIQGDPTLERTEIRNVDLRWEWFPGPTEVLAVTGFVKLFDQPIELVVVNGNGGVSFQNVRDARNLGVELEARFGLGHLSEKLGGFELGANATIVDSEIRLTAAQSARGQTPKRPLAGQSPWTLNASVGYAPTDGPFHVFLYYNVFGRRLDTVGSAGLPDTYELPFHALDLVFQYAFRDHWSLKGSFQNLAYSRTRLVTGGELARRVQPGVSGSLTLTYSN
jgi:TonB-dependent receptor